MIRAITALRRSGTICFLIGHRWTIERRTIGTRLYHAMVCTRCGETRWDIIRHEGKR